MKLDRRDNRVVGINCCSQNRTKKRSLKAVGADVISYRGETHYNYNLASTRRGVISDKKTISASCLDFEAI